MCICLLGRGTYAIIIAQCKGTWEEKCGPKADSLRCPFQPRLYAQQWAAWSASSIWPPAPSGWSPLQRPALQEASACLGALQLVTEPGGNQGLPVPPWGDRRWCPQWPRGYLRCCTYVKVHCVCPASSHRGWSLVNFLYPAFHVSIWFWRTWPVRE